MWGMTSLSIRQYIVGIYRMLGLKEQEVTKLQTVSVPFDSPMISVILNAVIFSLTPCANRVVRTVI